MFSELIHSERIGDQFLFFQPVERRIERPLLDLQYVVRDLNDALGDGPAVHRFERKRLQDEEVESALQQIGRFSQMQSP